MGATHDSTATGAYVILPEPPSANLCFATAIEVLGEKGDGDLASSVPDVLPLSVELIMTSDSFTYSNSICLFSNNYFSIFKLYRAFINSVCMVCTWSISCACLFFESMIIWRQRGCPALSEFPVPVVSTYRRRFVGSRR